jgi:site-specific recombinase XerC
VIEHAERIVCREKWRICEERAAERLARAHAHHNPIDAWARERVGRYRPKVPNRIPRAIPDQRFNQLFAALRSNRDRALVAFWMSTGMRASELLGMRQCDIDPGQQLITVIRKGTHSVQQVPASADAFVWLPYIRRNCAARFPRGALSRCGGHCDGPGGS